jgi:hypothetical protein
MKRTAVRIMSAFTLAINILPGQEISSPDDLIEVYLENRAVYLMIAPPADETYVQDMRESIFTFDEKAFDSDFLENLTGSQSGDVVYYPVTLAEDPETRDRLIYNSLGELIWRVSAPSSYSPSGSEPGINYPLGAADPARIRIRVTLMTKADKELLDELEAENALAESLVQSFRGDMELDGLWYEDNPPTNLMIIAVSAVSNNVVLTIGYPDTFTNRLEIFNFDSGDAPGHEQLAGTNSFWNLLATNIAVSGTSVTWTNTSLPTSLYRRFYVAGNADIDSDSDGLANAREIYLYHTSTSTNDTDGDGWTDYNEVLERHTDPNNGDTGIPQAGFSYPVNDSKWIGVP